MKRKRKKQQQKWSEIVVPQKQLEEPEEEQVVNTKEAQSPVVLPLEQISLEYDDTTLSTPDLKTLLIQSMATSCSIRFLFYVLYVYVIRNETDALVQDIIKLNERFANNSYSRIINELQIFISNTISSNSFDDSYQCALYGYIKSKTVEESQTIVSEIITTLTDFKFETEFFTQIYYDSVKSSMGIGVSLESIKKFIIPNEDFDYDPLEKNNLRGAHTHLSELRKTYNEKMNYNYRYNVSSVDSMDDNDNVVLRFTEKMKTLITNPDMMMCNQVISQNKINIGNLKQNVIAVNRLTVKDMYASILDSTDGVISVRIQNSITKCVYCTVFFVIVGIVAFLYRKICKKIN